MAPKALGSWRWLALLPPSATRFTMRLKVRIKELPLFPERVLTAIESGGAKDS